MWLVVKGQTRAAAQIWMFLTPKLSPNPPVVKAEPVCESAWLSNQTWAWQVEGWGCSWGAAETSHGASHSGLQPDQCGASQTRQLGLQAVVLEPGER